jgi:hypothetical protein
MANDKNLYVHRDRCTATRAETSTGSTYMTLAVQASSTTRATVLMLTYNAHSSLKCAIPWYKAPRHKAQHALQIARPTSPPALPQCFSRPLRPNPTPRRADAARTAYTTPYMSGLIDVGAADHGCCRPPASFWSSPAIRYSMLLHLPAAPFALAGGKVAWGRAANKSHLVLAVSNTNVMLNQ